MLGGVLSHLEALVAFDTRNPPRAIEPRGGVVGYCADALVGAGFTTSIDDLGDGCVNLLAVRGEPSVLINCHLDTVPVADGWTGDPLALDIDHRRAEGLGACDVKGSAACILAAVAQTRGDAAVLFTTDEEAGSSRCVRAFSKTAPEWIKGVVVCEPTGCQAVLEHRGIETATACFGGKAGHSSGKPGRSAIHDLARWASSACDAMEAAGANPHRFNIGRIEGGHKANMVASSAAARFGIRPTPDDDGAALLRTIRGAAPRGAVVEWAPGFSAPPLARTLANSALADRVGLPVGDAVDFWTEAALFAEAGLPALVFGPGNIAQAHAPDEWVSLDDLSRAASLFASLLNAKDASHAHHG